MNPNSCFFVSPRARHNTPGSSNIAIAGKWGPRIESMYFLLKTGGYSSNRYVIVFQRVRFEKGKDSGDPKNPVAKHVACYDLCMS